MQIRLITAPELAAMALACEELLAGPTPPQTLLVLAAEGNGWNETELADWCGRQPVPILGGLFPELVHQHGHYRQGAVVVGLEWILRPG